MFCECCDIIVRYGRAVVLDVKRLVVPAGRITGIVGPNGAGKTTLLEVMALLRRPSRGRVSLWGQPARDAGPKLRREVVMVMHPGYMFRGSVLQNVMYGLKARGIERKAAAIRAGEALDMVGLAEFARRDVVGLSAGERQRVNLARAIAVQPRAILLDEPTANVDSQTVEVVGGLLVRLRDQQETTIVYASPGHNQLHDVTDQVIELAAGRVRGSDEPPSHD